MIKSLLGNVGIKEIQTTAERFNHYLGSVDDDLRAMQQAMNTNFSLYADHMDKLQQEIQDLKAILLNKNGN